MWKKYSDKPESPDLYHINWIIYNICLYKMSEVFAN